MRKESQQHTVGAILVFVLMIIVSASTGYVVNKNIEASETLEFEDLGFNTQYDTQETIDQFSYHKKITLDHDQVDETLSGFPVFIHLSSDTDLASDALNSGWDIAFFDDGDNQLSHEIEYFDGATGELVVWVNVTSLSSSTDTEIYMYYGDSDIGSSAEDTAGTWDSNYEAVWHFDDSDNGLSDSLGAHDMSEGTGNGELESNDYHQTTYTPGYGIKFDLGGDQVCEHFTNGQVNELFSNNEWEQNWTLEIWVVWKNAGYMNQRAWVLGDESLGLYQLVDDPGGGWYFHAAHDDEDSNNPYDTSSNTTCFNTTYYYAHVHNNVLSNVSLFVNGTYYTGHDQTTFHDGPDNDFVFGAHYSLHKWGMDGGSIYEARASKCARNSSWLKTTYNNIINATDGNFFSLGLENAGELTSFSIKGLPSNKITFSGLAGTSVFCNDTGDTNEWLEINMSINTSDNVTEIRVFMDDLNDTDAWINASNITMYVSKDNSSYNYTTQSFTDGGSNISINATTWPSDAGTNPFTNGEGLTNKNTSIWLIFKVDIPAGLSTDDFWSSAIDSCKIYIGHYI